MWVGSRRRITVALLGLLVLVLGGWVVNDTLTGRDSNAVPGDGSGLQVRGLSTLPKEAAGTWHAIQAHQPLPYPGHDGTVFANRERRLPPEERGYYHEYTVPTPGSADRGARRLITGQGEELYYTQDHYETFVVVDAAR